MILVQAGAVAAPKRQHSNIQPESPHHNHHHHHNQYDHDHDGDGDQ